MTERLVGWFTGWLVIGYWLAGWYNNPLFVNLPTAWARPVDKNSVPVCVWNTLHIINAWVSHYILYMQQWRLNESLYIIHATVEAEWVTIYYTCNGGGWTSHYVLYMQRWRLNESLHIIHATVEAEWVTIYYNNDEGCMSESPCTSQEVR